MEQTQEGPDPHVGMLLLERYRIVCKIGEGGMGAVYEATHELIGRRVAVKCLHPQFASDAQVVARFQREAQASSMVGNEHIVDVTDMGRFPDGSPFIVLEFLEGQELGKLIERDGAQPLGRVVHILTQACRALGAAHAKGIVHRDLKPENIYLVERHDDPDFVKVIDFGISKMKEQAESLSGGLTKTGMALGTPYYMSPEQAQGLKDVDQRADVYALGVILFEALTGRLPFEADTYPLLMVKIMTEAPPPLRSYRPDLPLGLEQVAQQAMAKNRDERFRSVEELAAALAPFAHVNDEPVVVAPPRPLAPTAPGFGTPPPATAVGTPGPGTGTPWASEAPPPMPQRKSRTPLYVGAAVLGVLGLGAGGAALFASGAIPDPAPTGQRRQPRRRR